VQQSASAVHESCTPRQHSPSTHENPEQQSLVEPHSSPPFEQPHAPFVQLLPQQSLACVHEPPEGRQHCERMPKKPFVQGSPPQQSLAVAHAPPPDEQLHDRPLQLPPQQPASAEHEPPRTVLQHWPLTHEPLQHSAELWHAAPMSRQQ
jgi:hypothetical protein